MPYTWVEAEVYLQHLGTTIYELYKDDQLENGPRQYWFGFSPDCTDNGPAFDVRRLPNPQNHNVHTDPGRKAVIRDAIEMGVLQPPARR